MVKLPCLTTGLIFFIWGLVRFDVRMLVIGVLALVIGLWLPLDFGRIPDRQDGQDNERHDNAA